MVRDQLKLTLDPNSDNYQYIIDMIQDVDDRQSKDATSISLPGQSYKKNVLMGISGQTSEIDISFYIHDDGTDKADGSYTSTVVSIDEQIDYLKNTMQAPSFSAKWELDKIQGDNVYSYSAHPVFFEQVRMPTASRDSPNWRNCSISLVVGESI